MVTTQQIGSRTYNIGKLNCFEQLSVSRRLAPLMLTIIDAFKAPATGEEVSALDLAAGPLAKVLAEMREEDVDHVVKTCLSVVSVVVGETSVTLIDKGTKQLRYQDLSMQDMVALVIAVVRDSLGSFFPSAQPSPEQDQGSTA